MPRAAAARRTIPITVKPTTSTPPASDPMADDRAPAQPAAPRAAAPATSTSHRGQRGWAATASHDQRATRRAGTSATPTPATGSGGDHAHHAGHARRHGDPEPAARATHSGTPRAGRTHPPSSHSPRTALSAAPPPRRSGPQTPRRQGLLISDVTPLPPASSPLVHLGRVDRRPPRPRAPRSGGHVARCSAGALAVIVAARPRRRAGAARAAPLAIASLRQLTINRTPHCLRSSP